MAYGAPARRVDPIPGMICPRCGGSGEVPVIRPAPFTEDGLIRPDIQMTICEDCNRTGRVPDED